MCVCEFMYGCLCACVYGRCVCVCVCVLMYVCRNVCICLYINSFLQAPKICPGYQTGTFFIIIYDDTTHLLTQLGPLVYEQANEDEQILITKEVQIDSLSFSQYYEVKVIVERNRVLNPNKTRLGRYSKPVIKHN